MKKALFLCYFCVLTLSLFSQESRKLKILFTNDLHSHLTGFAPESDYSPLTTDDDKTVGGFARIASILKREKNEGQTTVIVDAGDFLMGTLFQSVETKTGFQLQLMKEMGYDVVALGNHEFDLGPEKFAEIVESAAKADVPAILMSNGVFSKKETADDRIEDLVNRNIISRKFILERDGLKIGFFSILGKVADENAAFAPPITFGKQVPLARKMIEELQHEKCDLIICLSHSGVAKREDGKWEGEDVSLAEKVKGIDVIISGHTHTELREPIFVNGTTIAQTGEYGKNVGKLVIEVDNGSVKFEEYKLISVDDRIEGDITINRKIGLQKQLVSSEILSPLGLDYNHPVAESDFLLECNEQGDFEKSNLGPLVADAIHNYVNNHSPEGTDISIVAVGVIRDRIVPGIQTATDIFRVMTMGSGEDSMPGYPLARVYVTGEELKNILEILQIAWKSTPANYCYYSGVKIGLETENGIFKKITKIEILGKDGALNSVDFSKKNHTLYSITANSYMLEFIGIIKKMSFGLINVVPKDKIGNPVKIMKSVIIDIDGKKEGIQEGKEWLALIEFLSKMKDQNGNGIPEIDNKYSNSLKP